MCDDVVCLFMAQKIVSSPIVPLSAFLSLLIFNVFRAWAFVFFFVEKGNAFNILLMVTYVFVRYIKQRHVLVKETF